MSSLTTTSDSVWTVIASPDTEATTTFACAPHGVIRGFRWDGLVLRFTSTVFSCSDYSGNPCFDLADYEYVPPTPEPWPGGPAEPLDMAGALGPNISGLHLERLRGPFLWAVRSTPGAILRLVRNESTWVADTESGWSAGKPIRYPGGMGNPAVQGMVRDDDSTGPFYVVADRDNDSPSVIRNSILGGMNLFDAGSEVIATVEYDLTADLPPGARIKAIAWGEPIGLYYWKFFDESTGLPINEKHVYFVGLDNGLIYGYVLQGSSFTRVATIDSGLGSVTGLDLAGGVQLWASCGAHCGGRVARLNIDPYGRFVPTRLFERPMGMPNADLQGFESSGMIWSDASNTDNHAIRSAPFVLP
jgi:hypothetical protein